LDLAGVLGVASVSGAGVGFAFSFGMALLGNR